MAGQEIYTVEHLQNNIKKYGSIAEASRATGIGESTYRRRLKEAKLPYDIYNMIENVELPPDDIPVEEIWQRALTDSKVRQTRIEAEDDWQRRKLNMSGPFGILWFGDPHLDDRNTNIVKAQEHIDIVKNSDVILAANIGDTLNGWVGNLQREYGNQNMSIARSLKIYNKFLTDINWWLWMYGNHCLWPTEASGVMKQLANNGNPKLTAEWSVKIAIQLPNGRELKIHAAHNFKGGGGNNKNAGLFKESIETGAEADIVIAGDHHVWQIDQIEHEKTGRIANLIRARGYKYGGLYEKMNGFRNQKQGHAVLTIINPDLTGPGFVTTFANPAYGAKVLSLLRKDWEKQQTKKGGRK